MAYSYSNIYGVPSTGLRFFTVYGPFGRPDMALFKFTKQITERKSIEVYNEGNHIRDFTYIDDVTEIIIKLINKTSKSKVPSAIYNISSNNPKTLKYFIKLIEKKLNLKAHKKYLDLQMGDVHKTHGNSDKINKYVNKYKYINTELGIENFIEWYKEYINKKI